MAPAMRLPQLKVTKKNEKNTDKPVLLVAGGREPGENWLRQTAAVFDKIWAVDKGLEYCMKAGLVPDVYIGDGDSVDEKGLRWADEKGVEVLGFSPEKDWTDLQLALHEAGRRIAGATVLVTGAWGGRFDHLLSAVFSLTWSFKWGVLPMGMADEKETLLFLNGPARARLEFYERPYDLSLLSLSSKCEGVSITGVRWELEDTVLLIEEPYAVSNEVLLSSGVKCGVVEISVEKGMLGLYLNFYQPGVEKEDCARQPS